jgi:zinc transport system ATP-binding protein
VSNSLIEFKKVDFSYNKTPVLEGVSFSLEKGGYLGILGPNGSGKTTLLKLLLGDLPLKTGSIFLNGKNIKEIKNFSFVGYVPQQVWGADFRFPVSAEEMVFAGRIARMRLFSFFNQDDKTAIEKALEITGVKEYRKKRIDELSGGERQKVFIARALALEPDLLLLDEPFVGVDEVSQKNFYAFLRGLNENLKMTIVLVSHDVDETVQETKNILFLNKSVKYFGPSEDFNKALIKEIIHRHVEHYA